MSKQKNKNANASANTIVSDKVKILAAISIVSLFSLFSLASMLPSALAAITCPVCQVGNCPCIVGACANGIFSVYSTAGCSRDPVFEYTFSNRNVPWAPSAEGTYYIQAYCDDGVTIDRCILQSVASSQPVTTTCESENLYTTSDCNNSCSADETCETTTSNGLTCYACQAKSVTSTPNGGGGGGGLDITWIIIAIIVVIAVIAFVVYRLFFTKKKTKGATYEELYRKWGGRPR